MNKLLSILFASLLLNGAFAQRQDQKIVSECTVDYSVAVENTKEDSAFIKSMSATTRTLYIKGTKSRSDLETPNFKQSIIFDSKTDSSIILRELGNTKYISYLDGNGRKEKNRKYEGIKFGATTDRKTILGYECNKVIATLSDGSTYEVYYTSSILPSAGDYEYQFKDLPGLVLEYEATFERGNTKVRFTAQKITLVPVPVAKFDIPKSGYRVL